MPGPFEIQDERSTPCLFSFARSNLPVEANDSVEPRSCAKPALFLELVPLLFYGFRGKPAENQSHFGGSPTQKRDKATSSSRLLVIRIGFFVSRGSPGNKFKASVRAVFGGYPILWADFKANQRKKQHHLGLQLFRRTAKDEEDHGAAPKQTEENE